MTEFHVNRRNKSGRTSKCKPCVKAACRSWYLKNKEHAAERQYKYKYGLSTEDVIALGDKCRICGTTENLCVDHDHETGKVRGILCSKHNMALGLLGDNIKYLEAAIEYLNG